MNVRAIEVLIRTFFSSHYIYLWALPSQEHSTPSTLLLVERQDGFSGYKRDVALSDLVPKHATQFGEIPLIESYCHLIPTAGAS